MPATKHGQNGIKQQFGNRAIMESMSYMMERMITRGSVPVPDYPYNAAEMCT